MKLCKLGFHCTHVIGYIVYESRYNDRYHGTQEWDIYQCCECEKIITKKAHKMYGCIMDKKNDEDWGL